jgi:hypothetical protein
MEEDADEARRLDGNAAAGLLREVFAVEMTARPRSARAAGGRRRWPS